MKSHFLVYLMLMSAAVLFSDGIWNLEHRDEIVSVYARDVSYCRYREYRSVTDVPINIEKVFDVFTDFHGYHRWFGFCKDSYTVKDHSQTKKTVFLLIDTPWPLIDKYLLPDVSLDFSFEDGNAGITFELTDDRYNIEPGKYEPVVNVRGNCLLQQLYNGATRVTFTCSMDPGGNIPVVFIEQFQLDQMIKTAANLHSHLKLLFDFCPTVPESHCLVKNRPSRR